MRLYQISVFEHNQQQVLYSWLFTDKEIEPGICINKTSQRKKIYSLQQAGSKAHTW